MIIGKEHINALIKQLFIHMVRGHVFKQLQSVLNGEVLLLGHTTKSHHIAVGWNFYQQGRTISFSLFSQVQSGGGSSGGGSSGGGSSGGGSSGQRQQRRREAAAVKQAAAEAAAAEAAAASKGISIGV